MAKRKTKREIAREKHAAEERAKALENEKHDKLPGTPAERLALAAERNGMTVADAARFDDILQDFGIARDECNPALIETAHSIHRGRIIRLQKAIEARTRRLGLIASNGIADMVAKDAREEIPTKPIKTVTKAKPAAPKRQKLFDQSITAVIRWMGKTGGWKPEEVSKAVKHLTGTDINDATIKIQLKAGKTGGRGEPAPITKAQAKVLREAATA